MAKHIEKKEESIPQRIYTEAELKDFHNKIQKFWEPTRHVVLPKGMSGPAAKFRHEDLHVAYGAARKVQHGTQSVYLYNQERYQQFTNLWSQYENWRQWGIPTAPKPWYNDGTNNDIQPTLNTT